MASASPTSTRIRSNARCKICAAVHRSHGYVVEELCVLRVRGLLLQTRLLPGVCCYVHQQLTHARRTHAILVDRFIHGLRALVSAAKLIHQFVYNGIFERRAQQAVAQQPCVFKLTPEKLHGICSRRFFASLLLCGSKVNASCVDEYGEHEQCLRLFFWQADNAFLGFLPSSVRIQRLSDEFGVATEAISAHDHLFGLVP